MFKDPRWAAFRRVETAGKPKHACANATNSASSSLRMTLLATCLLSALLGRGEGPQIGVGILASVKDALTLRISDDEVVLCE